MTWLDIDGWLTREEGDALRLLAVGADVLELGSYKGRSTVAMAEVARHVTAVDWHRGDAGCGRANTLQAFIANMLAHGVADQVSAIVCRVDQAEFPPASFDLAFIDDDHEGDAPLVATRLALRCVRPGGVIAWHDWNVVAVRCAAATCGLVPHGLRNTLAWATVPAARLPLPMPPTGNE